MMLGALFAPSATAQVSAPNKVIVLQNHNYSLTAKEYKLIGKLVNSNLKKFKNTSLKEYKTLSKHVSDAAAYRVLSNGTEKQERELELKVNSMIETYAKYEKSIFQQKRIH